MTHQRGETGRRSKADVGNLGSDDVSKVSKDGCMVINYARSKSLQQRLIAGVGKALLM